MGVSKMTLETKPPLNCKPCQGDHHDNCTNPETCLCAIETNHNEPTLRDGVRVDFEKPIDSSFYDQVKEVNEEIKQEPKSFKNDNWDIVADLIQSDNHFITLRENKEIWYYDGIGKIYKPYAHTIIEEACQRLINKCQNKTVREVVDTIRRNKTYVNAKDLFESRHINAKDGILDPDTFELMPHSPEYLTTSKLPFSIASNTRNLKLWNHILTIIDVKDINKLMELVWICISWNNPFKKLFVFKGLTNTQKSTLAEILVWIIGRENVSFEKPMEFLGKNRFSTSKFIGRRINIASEIGNFTENMFEVLKSLVGAEPQNTEKKGDNTERYFDPTHFVFLFTTNKLGEIYSKINDDSTITRFEILLFRNQLDSSKTNGQWYDHFFVDENDKQTAIDTIVKIVINYKKAQKTGKIPKTMWSGIAETKQILREEMPIEDKYFEDGRIINKDGSKISLNEIKKDFESFVGYSITDPQKMGYILKAHGFKSVKSNGVTYYKGYAFASAKEQGQTDLTSHSE